MEKAPTKIQVNALTDAMVRGGELKQKDGKWRVGVRTVAGKLKIDRKVFSQAIVDAAKERINLVEDENGVWKFKPA